MGATKSTEFHLWVLLSSFPLQLQREKIVLTVGISAKYNFLKEVFFLDVKMSFWTNVVESVCVCRMITKVGALQSLHPEDTFSYL